MLAALMPLGIMLGLIAIAVMPGLIARAAYDRSIRSEEASASR